MKKYLKFFTFAFVLLCFGNSNAQEVEADVFTHQQKILPPGTIRALEGTYQIIKIGAKTPQDLFTDDLLYLIEANRNATADVTINIGSHSKVRILSSSVINDPAFVPLSGEILIEPTE